jgi:hypothetical protein
MSQVTLRMEEWQYEAASRIASDERINRSEVFRTAIRRYMIGLAESDPQLQEMLDVARQQELEAAAQRVREKFDSPSPFYLHT